MTTEHIFISYAHHDRAFVDTLAARLEAADVAVWYDRDLTPGRPWSAELEAHIREAQAVVVVLSPASAGSEYVRKEIHFAQEAGKRIVPVLLHATEVPLPLADLQWVDAQEGQDPLPGLLAALRGEAAPDLKPPEVLPPSPEPLELRLKVWRAGDDGLQASLSLPEASLDAGPSPFASPLEANDLGELRWYLESYPRWPVGPDVKRAARLERRLKEWGAALFQAVFSDLQALRLWQQFRDRTDRPRLLTLDATDPDVLRQPWELLADEEGHLFALGVSLRRRVHKVQAAAQVPFDLPVRILMIVARPKHKSTSFIDPRASSQALLEAVAPLGTENVVVEFLHPPTLQALDRRLRDRKQPPVHVVHFDGHGVYRMEEGLGFLAFEDDQGKLDLVDADRLGTLLAAAQVPLMVLEACQSAHADAADPFTSLAPRLIQAGVGSVVAMQYSVLVPTSKRFFAAFYRTLAEGRPLGQAMDEGRRDLLADTKRLTLYRPDEGEVALHLRDWFLPALYQQTADPTPFEGAVIRPAGEVDEHLPLLGDFPEPRYPFTGRAQELWELERLLRERRILVVHGFGGQGKTALASEAARWLTRTGLFARALFLSFEEGGEADWAVTQMGRLLRGDDFSALPQAERLPALKEALVETPTLVVWDNCESLLPGWQAELPAEALQELLGLGADLADEGLTRLVVTTRDPELQHPDYAPSQRAARLALGGLVPPEALAFAGEVLDTLGHSRPERPDLERLLDYLGGHPLSIQLVLPHLQDYGNDVATVIARFDQLYPGFTEGRARERHESLEVSLSFSLSRLSQAARDRLPALGVFEGGAMEVQILPVTGLKPSQWREIRAELERAGLVTPDLEMPISIETEEGDFYGRYVRFHPTLPPHLRRRLADEARRALEERYRQGYYQLSRYLYHADPSTPHQARAVALRELPNLRRALDLTLAAGDLETAVEFAEGVEHFLNYFGRWRERAALMAKVEAATEVVGEAAEGPLTKAAYLLASRRGELFLDQGRAREAEQVFRQLLARMDAGTAYESTYDRALTLHRLGRSLAGQGRPREAEAEFGRALGILAELDPERSDVRRQTGAVHTDLADVLTDQGRYAEAREQYEAGLKAIRAIGDDRSEAAILGQLGTLALVEEDYAEARRRYREALARFRALGETRSEAIYLHQLGRVAQEEAARAAGEQRAALLEEAEAAYQESLRLEEALGNPAGAAQTANQLAIVARRAGRPADAERWYRRAIELGKEIGDLQGLAKRYNNLAFLLLAVHRAPAGERPPEFAGRDLLAEAETWAHKARELKEQIGDLSLRPWTTYNILAQITQEREDGEEEARAWRRKERAAYAAFPGHWARLAPRWGPVVQAVAAAARGDEQARQAVEEAFEAMKEGGWHNLVAALHRVLAEERDAEALVEAHNLDREDYLILLKTLEAPAGEARQRLEQLGQEARAQASESQAAQALAAFQQWLETPEGQAALKEIQAQGLSEEQVVPTLLQRFLASGGGEAG